MAKAREIPGLSTELAYGEVAARVLEVRAEELIEHADGVLDIGRIEGVHDMRVATRRLRAAIEVFWPCFPEGRAQAALAEVKALADALGERRDRDVAIDVARTLRRVDAGARPARDRLADRASSRTEQLEANEELAPFVEAAGSSGSRSLASWPRRLACRRPRSPAVAEPSGEREA